MATSVAGCHQAAENQSDGVSTHYSSNQNLSQEMAGGQRVSIIIGDNGCGMPANVRTRAIEPFFSTRAGEGGTGLGLSIVYGFIKQSGGNLEIDSEEGVGTKVSISLPLATAGAAPREYAAVQTALIIDDDQQAREAACSALKELQYQATSCGTTDEALSLISEHAFDLVVSDYNLGKEMNGSELLMSVADKLPDAKKILISGKSSLSKRTIGSNIFIEKPITPSKLSRILSH